MSYYSLTCNFSPSKFKDRINEKMVDHTLLFLGLSLSGTLLWYFSTPYLVNPSKQVMRDIYMNVPLATSSNPSDSDTILIENWTKWRLYLNSDQTVIYPHSAENVKLKEKFNELRFEWRSEYCIQINKTSDDNISVKLEDLWYSKYGIYRHFQVEKMNSKRIRITPRFLFGVDFAHLDRIYEGSVGNMPIIGLFSESANVDRAVILSYLSMILLTLFAAIRNYNKAEFESRSY